MTGICSRSATALGVSLLVAFPGSAQHSAPSGVGSTSTARVAGTTRAWPIDSTSPGAVSGSAWVWPLEPTPRVVRAFDPPADPWGAGNRGVDLLGSLAQPVMAIATGDVTFARALAGRGVVVVDHGALRSTYEPVTASVHVGQHVVAGQVIGLLQSTYSHCVPEICLHLGLRRGDLYLDPLAVLGPLPVRLKPLSSDDRGAAGLSPGTGRRSLVGSEPSSAAASGSRRSQLGPRAAVAAGVGLVLASVLSTVVWRGQARG